MKNEERDPDAEGERDEAGNLLPPGEGSKRYKKHPLTRSAEEEVERVNRRIAIREMTAPKNVSADPSLVTGPGGQVFSIPPGATGRDVYTYRYGPGGTERSKTTRYTSTGETAKEVGKKIDEAWHDEEYGFNKYGLPGEWIRTNVPSKEWLEGQEPSEMVHVPSHAEERQDEAWVPYDTWWRNRQLQEAIFDQMDKARHEGLDYNKMSSDFGGNIFAPRLRQYTESPPLPKPPPSVPPIFAMQQQDDQPPSIKDKGPSFDLKPESDPTMQVKPKPEWHDFDPDPELVKGEKATRSGWLNFMQGRDQAMEQPEEFENELKKAEENITKLSQGGPIPLLPVMAPYNWALRWLITGEPPDFKGIGVNLPKAAAQGGVMAVMETLRYPPVLGDVLNVEAKDVLDMTYRTIRNMNDIEDPVEYEEAKKNFLAGLKYMGVAEGWQQMLMAKIDEVRQDPTAIDRVEHFINDYYMNGDYYKMMTEGEQTMLEYLKVDKDYERSFTRIYGQGLGFVMSQYMTGLLGKLGTKMAIGGAALRSTMALSGSALQALDEALKDERVKKNPRLALHAALLGHVPGVLDILPIEVLLGSQAVTNGLMRGLVKVGKQAALEGSTEVLQDWTNNWIAQRLYAPEKEIIDWVQSRETAEGASAVGATMEALAILLEKRRHLFGPKVIQQLEAGNAAPFEEIVMNVVGPNGQRGPADMTNPMGGPGTGTKPPSEEPG